MQNRNYVREMLEQFSADHQNRIALELYNGKQTTQISYSGLAEKILTAAGFFRENGWCGRHIALMGSNSQDWIVAVLAIAASGNVAVPLNPSLPKESVLSQCFQADISVICGDAHDISDFSEAYPCISYGMLCDGAPMQTEDIVCPDPDGWSVVMFTRGTTGESKAVAITHSNMATSLKSADGVFAEPDNHKNMTVLPMFHIAGIRGALAMLCRFKTLCIGRGIMYLFRDMPILMPDYILMVPLMVDSLVKIMRRTSPSELREKYIGTNLKRICVGGAAVDPENCRYLMENGFTIDGGYALSETTGVGTWGKWDAAHFNTIGKPSDELQCRIVDGELQFKGQAVMKGYYKAPEATSLAIQDGWLHTGDLAFCDQDGYYYLTGRKKNLIVMANGEKLNPEEVERQFESSSAIDECRIWYHEQDGILCIEIYANNKDAAQLSIELYNERMPLSYQIRRIVFRDKPFERTASGKPLRKERG